MSLNLNDPLYKSEDFHHVGIVVKDIEKTIEHLEASGIGPFGMTEGDKACPWRPPASITG